MDRQSVPRGSNRKRATANGSTTAIVYYYFVYFNIILVYIARCCFLNLFFLFFLNVLFNCCHAMVNKVLCVKVIHKSEESQVRTVHVSPKENA